MPLRAQPSPTPPLQPDEPPPREVGRGLLVKRLMEVALVVFGLLVLSVVATLVAFSYARANVGDLIAQQLLEATGIQIVAPRSTVTLSTHLRIALESPRVYHNGSEVARLQRLTLSCSYHALIFSRGLPLFAVTLDRPVIRLPPPAPGAFKIPLPGVGLANLLDRKLREFSSVTRRFFINDATLVDSTGEFHLLGTDVSARRGFLMRSPWRLKFAGRSEWHGHRSQLAGDLILGSASLWQARDHLRGSIWIWNVALDGLGSGGFQAYGDANLTLKLGLRSDGLSSLGAKLRISRFQLGGPRLIGATSPATLESVLALRLASDRFTLDNVSLKVGALSLLKGDGWMESPDHPNPQVGLRLGALAFDLSDVKAFFGRLREQPKWLGEGLAMVKSGRLKLDQAYFLTDFNSLLEPSAQWLKRMRVEAMIDNGQCALPARYQLPDAQGLQAVISLRRGQFQLNQGSVRLGDSAFDAINLKADLGSLPNAVSYDARLESTLDLTELFSKLRGAGAVSSGVAQRLTKVEGESALSLELSGEADQLGFGLREFTASLKPNQVLVEYRGLPSPLKLSGGEVVATAKRVSIRQVTIAANKGNGQISAQLDLQKRTLHLEKLEAEVRQLPAEVWLPQILPDDTITARGPLNGYFMLTADAAAAGGYQVNGQLVLGPGRVRFLFLRSPILVNRATLALDGQSAKFSMPGSTLEGHGLDMTVSVPDFHAPTIRIDANCQYLDLETIVFVRLPWEPKTPVVLAPGKFEGHIVAAKGRLEKLQLTNLTSDFTRTNGDWRVYNFDAQAMGGEVKVDVSGRQADDWIHLKVHFSRVQMPALLEVISPEPPVIEGTLFADGDIWGDTNNDFFKTSGGRFSLLMTNGILHKFRLLSRLLSLVDLSQWLNAQVPNPLVKGVPFNNITGDFLGKDGDFYTNNFLLDGPVMKITAAGQLNLSDATLHMQVGMRPFQLLDTVFNKIPLIGQRLTQSETGIIAAYFNVNGPIKDPSVVPAPITSIGQFVLKTLGLPINLIRPNTIGQ